MFKQLAVRDEGRRVSVTSSRFTRISQAATWSCGGDSADAVCVSVCQDNVALIGVCVYVGTGRMSYDLDLLEYVSGNMCHNRNDVGIRVVYCLTVEGGPLVERKEIEKCLFFDEFMKVDQGL